MTARVSPTGSVRSTGVAPEAVARARESWVAAGLKDPATLVMIGVLATVVGWACWDWFARQNRFSLKSPQDWGHAYVIPLVAGYLVWLRRADLARARPEVYWPGLTVVAFGVMGYFFFAVGIENHMLQGFSVVSVIGGLVMLLLGPGPLRVLLVPTAYLGFAVTISPMVMEQITFELQIMASKGAYLLLRVLGPLMSFTVDIEGNHITVVPRSGEPATMNVADACSGMRMVIAFIALAAAVAMSSCSRWWQRTALVLLAVPVAVLLNIVRVAVLGLASLVDPGLAAGDAHMLIGTLLLVPGLGLFMLVVWVLNRVVREAPAGGGA